MSYYSDNDDDLFDYEYKESETTHNFESSENVINLKEKINIRPDDIDLENIAGNLHNAKISISLAFHKAFTNFIDIISGEALAKTLSVTLDTLTNGDFSLLANFYKLEMQISRKMIFLQVSDQGLTIDEDNYSFIKAMNQVFNIDTDEFYVNNFFRASLNICEFSLQIDRAKYLSLSKKLQIPVNQFLFEDPYTTNEKNHLVDIESYRANNNERVLQEMVSQGLLQEISNFTGITPSLFTNEENQ